MTVSKTQFINLFGRQYKVRCPSGEETVLKQTEDLLNQQLQATKKGSGLTNREDIIMMTALNLCRSIVEQQEKDKAAAKHLAESQAAAMVNPPQKELNKRTGGSAIADAASKASQFLKEKRP
ncbi:cell division protein ZapA [Planctobacterium marinum]|uniref:Cell division protein ZapA n=1 Tax=Planctobacterium marinum TaxID=1631968 RepID=A0AA48KRW1_9ALTE|nr:hypothetical protein MACH26_13600 [Planctobacterium marinum]